MEEKYSTVIVPKPTAFEFLTYLRNNGIPLCIATDTPKWLAKGFFDRYPEFSNLFDFYIDSEDAGASKRQSGIIYLKAAEILNRHKIDTVTHLMIGLPGESDDELRESVRLVNKAKPFGIKIHSVYVAEGTYLAKMYREGKYTPIERDTYTDRAVYVLTHISPDTVVHRITGDCPKNMLVAPEWNLDKNAVISEINAKMKRLVVKQGCFYEDSIISVTKAISEFKRTSSLTESGCESPPFKRI